MVRVSAKALQGRSYVFEGVAQERFAALRREIRLLRQRELEAERAERAARMARSRAAAAVHAADVVRQAQKREQALQSPEYRKLEKQMTDLATRRRGLEDRLKVADAREKEKELEKDKVLEKKELKEKELERERKRLQERGKEREKQKQGQKEKEKERGREREKESKNENEREKEREEEREEEKQMKKEKKKARMKEKEKGVEKERENGKERETEREQKEKKEKKINSARRDGEKVNKGMKNLQDKDRRDREGNARPNHHVSTPRIPTSAPLQTAAPQLKKADASKTASPHASLTARPVAPSHNAATRAANKEKEGPRAATTPVKRVHPVSNESPCPAALGTVTQSRSPPAPTSSKGKEGNGIPVLPSKRARSVSHHSPRPAIAPAVAGRATPPRSSSKGPENREKSREHARAPPAKRARPAANTSSPHVTVPGRNTAPGSSITMVVNSEKRANNTPSKTGGPVSSWGGQGSRDLLSGKRREGVNPNWPIMPWQTEMMSRPIRAGRDGELTSPRKDRGP